ncbi:hypothetical protein ABZ387_34935 [Streptomyces flaveolus]|uniref:hypothetical protein n=1 Tax=Streptomyces flaveolus TaxID=67297 RepID=UPI0033D9A000
MGVGTGHGGGVGSIVDLAISYGKADDVAEYAAALCWLVHTALSASIRRENACGRELLPLLLRDGSAAVIATR